MKHTNTMLHIIGYISLVIFAVVWYEVHHLSIWVATITTIPLIIADIFSDYNPGILAFIYTRRKQFAIFVFVMCLLFSLVLYIFFPFHIIYSNLPIREKFILITQFTLQGAIVGLTIRMLLLNLFADMLRAKGIHKAKLLIMIAWIVFIIMFPINNKHISLSSFFITGFGFGFLLHYLIRTQDKKDAQRNRLRENILSMITTLKEEELDSNFNSENKNKNIKLTPAEETAINLYSNQKWNRLKLFLNTHEETTTLFFIKLSMLRKIHNYDNALSLIKDKLEDEKEPHQHFIHLHYALNESERFNHNGTWKNKNKIFSHLEIANNINPNCLLTCATYALRLAGEIKPGKDNQKEKDKALQLIWKAMKLYEDDARPKMVSLITGMTIPVTYTFLLDTYGYVLLKCDRLRFAKALLLQCLFQDPSYSATYLHLAEWYYEFYGNQRSSRSTINENWRKSAKLNLLIAVEFEKELDFDNQGTLISIHAKNLLKKI